LKGGAYLQFCDIQLFSCQTVLTGPPLKIKMDLNTVFHFSRMAAKSFNVINLYRSVHISTKHTHIQHKLRNISCLTVSPSAQLITWIKGFPMLYGSTCCKFWL